MRYIFEAAGLRNALQKSISAANVVLFATIKNYYFNKKLY